MTTRLPLLGAGASGAAVPLTAPPGEHLYGSEAATLRTLPGADRWLVPGLSEAMVRFAARFEMARTVEDVLARRSRLLFLDAQAAEAQADAVAALLREELGREVGAEAFKALARRYHHLP
jgi:glycerol-3-phosphate dehydrogenase